MVAASYMAFAMTAANPSPRSRAIVSPRGIAFLDSVGGSAFLIEEARHQETARRLSIILK